MGYTHYYYVSSYYKQETWNALLKDVKKLLLLPRNRNFATDFTFGELINQKDSQAITKSELDSLPYYNIDEKEISFNGFGELAHEQFQLYQRMPPDVFERQEEFAKSNHVPQVNQYDKGGRTMAHPYFECTKTARKPYDIVVQCCLILAKKHLGKGISISSDGEKDDWLDAINIIEKDFGYKVKTRWSRDEGEIFSQVK